MGRSTTGYVVVPYMVILQADGDENVGSQIKAIGNSYIWRNNIKICEDIGEDM